MHHESFWCTYNVFLQIKAARQPITDAIDWPVENEALARSVGMAQVGTHADLTISREEKYSTGQLFCDYYHARML